VEAKYGQRPSRGQLNVNQFIMLKILCKFIYKNSFIESFEFIGLLRQCGIKRLLHLYSCIKLLSPDQTFHECCVGSEL
jgi:hypothetical protein